MFVVGTNTTMSAVKALREEGCDVTVASVAIIQCGTDTGTGSGMIFPFVVAPHSVDRRVIFAGARKQSLRDCQLWKRKKKGRS